MDDASCSGSGVRGWGGKMTWLWVVTGLLIAAMCAAFGADIYCDRVAYNHFDGYYPNVESRISMQGCQFRVVGEWLTPTQVHRVPLR